MQGFLKGIIPSLLNAVLPSICPVCLSATDNYRLSPFCLKCWEAVAPYAGYSCGLCSAPLHSPHASVCAECRREKPVFDRALSYGLYAGTLKEAIGLLKFNGIRRLAGPLGEMLFSIGLPDADMIIPVPLDISGLKQRGFNQTLLIGKTLSKRSGIPLGTGLLVKKRKTAPQVGLQREERLKNLRGAFGVDVKLKGKRIILFDDVMTTGATATECARELYKAGAEEVTVVVMARA